MMRWFLLIVILLPLGTAAGQEPPPLVSVPAYTAPTPDYPPPVPLRPDSPWRTTDRPSSISRTSIASPWHWSPAGEHHRAMVRVLACERGGYSCGSGCYVTDGSRCGVLTAAHALRGRPIEIVWSDGTRSRSNEPAIDKYGHDVGFVPVRHESIQPLRVAGTTPRPGDRVEICGFGGGDDKPLRHWWARYRGVTGRLASYDAPIMEGDSGGVVLNEGHEVVGVVTLGTEPVVGKANGCTVYAGSRGPPADAVCAFLSRIFGRCGPGYCPTPRQRSGGGWAYPPDDPTTPIRPRQTPHSSAPAQRATQPESPSPVVDYDRLAGILLDRIAKDDRFRGPRGEHGPPGKDGRPGRDGKDGRTPTRAELLALVGQALEDLPGIRIPVRDDTGTVIDYREIRLGDEWPGMVFEKVDPTTGRPYYSEPAYPGDIVRIWADPGGQTHGNR